jgi:hypothetical protein
VRVEFIGEYEDFDWDGDGVWREWQYQTRYGVLHHHIGTATAPPWRVAWDASRLPDQVQPIRVRARITDATGLTYLTPPLEDLRLERARRRVRMFTSQDVPDRFSARAGGSAKCNIDVRDLDNARAAWLIVSTWSASTDDESIHELRLNGERLANRFGQFHNYSYDRLPVPLDRLRRGSNEIAVFSEFTGHGLEVNWPGPALVVEYEK